MRERIGVLISILPLILFLGLLIWSDTGDKDITLVPCFDKFGNEIIGLVCEEKVISDPLKLAINYSYPLMLLFGAIWGIGFSLAWGKWWYED